MRRLLCLTTFALAITVLQCVGWAEEEREPKPRMKGVELYSWNEKGDWLFVLRNGTNSRTADQAEAVKGAKSPIKGAEDLKKALAHLAVGEYVFWNVIDGFDIPPDATRKEIEDAAKEAKLKLSGPKQK